MSRQLLWLIPALCVCGWGWADDRPRLEPWMQSQIIDKVAIAEDAERRALGLRQSGNPQLRAGTILEDAEPAEPNVDKEFERQLRERQLEMFATRDVSWNPALARSEQPNGSRPSPGEPRKPADQTTWNLIVFGVALGLVASFILRRR